MTSRSAGELALPEPELPEEPELPDPAPPEDPEEELPELEPLELELLELELLELEPELELLEPELSALLPVAESDDDEQPDNKQNAATVHPAIRKRRMSTPERIGVVRSLTFWHQ